MPSVSATTTPVVSRLSRILICSGFGLGYAGIAMKFSRLPETWLFMLIAAFGGIIFLLLIRDWHLLFVGALSFCLPLLYFDVNIYYDARAGGDSGIAIGVLELALLALWLESVATLPREERRALSPSALRWLVPALFLAALISSTVAVKPNIALFEIIRIGKMVLLWRVVATAVNNKAALRTLLVALFLITNVESFLGFAQKITNGPIAHDLLGEKNPIMTVELDDGEAFTRVGGTLGHPNELARFLGLVLPMALAMMIGTPDKKFRWLATITFLLGSLALLLTLTRGAWFGMAAALTLVFILALRHPALKTNAWRSLRFLLFLIVPILLLNLDTLKSRFTSDDKGSFDTRLPMARVALKIIEANPLRGVGIGNYREWLPQFGDPDNPFTLEQKVHNLYLLLASEMGIYALVIFLGILLVAFGTCLKLAHRAPLPQSLIAIGMAGGLLAFAIHSMVDYVELARVPILWCYLGLLWALQTQTDKEATAVIAPEKLESFQATGFNFKNSPLFSSKNKFV